MKKKYHKYTFIIVQNKGLPAASVGKAAVCSRVNDYMQRRREPKRGPSQNLNACPSKPPIF